MRVVTVARKPLSEGTVAANVIVHGCGAINIDGCRIKSLDQSDAPLSHDHGRGMGYHGAKDHGPCGRTPLFAGRWPANLILVHKPGCRQDGTRQVKGQNPQYKAHGKGGTRQVYGFAGSRPAQIGIGHADADGMETTLDWNCTPGCPVSGLDNQTGVLTSGSVKPGYSRGNNDSYFARDRLEDQNLPAENGTQLTGYGDSGGASRFFKQVKA